MAGKRINLLSQQAINPKVHTVIRFLRVATFVVGAITMVILSVLFYQKNRVESEYQQYLAQKESLINEFAAKRETVQKVQYVALKSQALSGLLSKDPKFRSYYSLFTSTLPIASGSAQMSTFVVDKGKAFKTSISFAGQPEAYALMNNIESNQFAAVFASLTVDSVTVGKSSEDGPEVVVSISGVFK